MSLPCLKCNGLGFINCKACKGQGDDVREASGVCVACGGPGRFPCYECDTTGLAGHRRRKDGGLGVVRQKVKPVIENKEKKKRG